MRLKSIFLPAAPSYRSCFLRRSLRYLSDKECHPGTLQNKSGIRQRKKCRIVHPALSVLEIASLNFFLYYISSSATGSSSIEETLPASSLRLEVTMS